MTKAKETRKAARTEAKKESKKIETPKAEPKPKVPKITQKSTMIELVSRPGGATFEEIGQEAARRGLGTVERCVATSKLWFNKLGIPLKKDEKTGKITKA
jgi:hypothetical protein